ncbi:MAG: hypothetical protein AMJ38_00165, partial [Dehalococcoidia bacterium DG_22]
MRKFIFRGTAAGLIVGLLALLLVLVPAGTNDTAQAQGGTGNFPCVVGIDVDPYTAGDANTNLYVGAVENCKRVDYDASGDTDKFDIDVFVDDVPGAGHPGGAKDLGGANFYLDYDNNGAAPGYLQINGFVGPTNMGCFDWVLRTQAGSAACMETGETAWPDNDGNLSVVAVDPSGAAGAELPGTRGVIDRYEMEVMQAGPKVIALTIAGAPTILATSVPTGYDPDQLWDGNYPTPYGLVAIDTDCPQPTDVKKTIFEAVDLPAPYPDPIDLDVSETLWFHLHEQLHNNGPMTPLPVEITVEGTPPEGGEVSYHVSAEDLALPGDLLVTKNGAPWVGPPHDGGLNPPESTEFVVGFPDVLDVHKQVDLPYSDYPDLYEDWDIHCLTPSQHTWHFHNEVWPLDPVVIDPEPGNNVKDLDIVVNCLAESDVKITDMSVLNLPAKKPIDDSPYELPYPTLYVDEPTDVTLSKTVHNNFDDGSWDAYGPSAVTVTRTGAVVGYAGMNAAYADCVITPGTAQNPTPLVVSTAQTVTEPFTITCGRGGIEYNDDAAYGGSDVFIDEDPVNGVDDDGDLCEYDEDGSPASSPGAGNCCDTIENDATPDGIDAADPECAALAIDEDSAFYVVVVLFTNTLDLDNPHTTDPNPDLNVLTMTYEDAWAMLQQRFTVIRPFDATFDYVVDSSAPDDVTTPPASDSCIASPLFPCKTLSDAEVAGVAPPPGAGYYGDMPLVAQMSIIADDPGDMAWMSGAPWANCPLFGGACAGITNAATV